MVTAEHASLAFRTQRLALRGIVEADFPTICAMEHPEADESANALEKTASLHKKLLAKNHFHFLIYLLPETQHLNDESNWPSISWEDASAGTPVGNAGMMGNYELGYMIAPDHRRKGYASEAVSGILKQVWKAAEEDRLGPLPRDDKFGKEYVMASVEPSNVSSIRVLEKVGAVEEDSSNESEGQSSHNTKDRSEKKPLKKFRMYR